MTKSKPEPASPFCAYLSTSRRSGADMETGGGARVRKTHRRALRVTSPSPGNAQKTSQPVPVRTEAKDANLKPTCLRGTKQELKPDGTKRTEMAKKSRGRVKLIDARDPSPDDPSKISGFGKDAVKLSSTDSSSEISDCTSEENKVPNDAQSSDFETGSDAAAAADRERVVDSGLKVPEITVGCEYMMPTPGLGIGERSISPGDQRSFASVDSRLNFSAFSDLTGDFVDAVHEDLLREIEDLRSENEYLKDEMEGLRSEMLEMRDVYMEEDIYQLQDLRQQLDQANKTCRILQYRLRKAERHSIRVAQTGQVDGELIRSLEQDVRVAKSVSLRLHSELEAVQKKNTRLEWENEELRERLQALEVAKQVLQSEMDKSNQNSLKRRSLRSTASKSEKRLSQQDDSADLKCQLHFAKEESALMCKKLTKMAVECESMREELAKYRLLYGDVDASQAAAGTANSAHTREAEVKVHLRLVEEEATLLSRRIVELEVENRGLRAEMSELRERALASQAEGNGSMEGGGERLSVYLGEGEETNEFVNSGHPEVEKRTEDHIPSVDPGGIKLEDCQLSQILREGPIGGERDPLEDQEKTVESAIAEKSKMAHCEQGYLLSLKDLESLLALRDQATLAQSTIQFLTSPSKNGLSPTSSHNFIPGSPYLSKTEIDSQYKTHPWLLDPMLSPLTSGLEVLQVQLRSLVAKVETLISSASSVNESSGLILETDENSNGDKVIESHKQKEQSLAEEISSQPCSPQEHNEQDSLELLILQLYWFLQQWRQGERPTTECNSLFETDFQKDLYFQMETGFRGSKKTCNPHKKCQRRVSCALLSDLRAALKDLGCELLEEYRAGQHIAQQFAQAKAAWIVECTELKSLINRLEGTSAREGSKVSPDLKIALQKDHVEKLQHLLAESYTAVMDLTKQLKVCERNWNCERKELLKHLNQARLEWDKQNKGTERPQKESEGEMKRMKPKSAPSTRNSNKNWAYLSHEAARMDRDDPCKTWDCPMMPPSFPDLNLKQETLKSHTAPERTAIRIYYSPPSARRINLSAVTIQDLDECEENQETLEPHYSSSFSQLVNGDSSSVYESWQGLLPLECQSATEWHPFTSVKSSSSSGFQALGVSSPSGLPFSGLDVSSNMSDDMKEMTASVLQSSHLSPAEKRSGRDSGSQILGMVSTGTQTLAKPQVNSVGLQTENPRNVYGGRHWSPRVTSFVSGRTQQISTSLERMPGSSERAAPCSTSPKLQRRHSASSPFFSSSSSSSSSNSNSSPSFTSSSLSSSSSLTSSSRLETAKARGLWGLSQCNSGSTTWTHSSSTRPSSAPGLGSDKPTGRKSVGLVQEFFRNVCGRGEKPNPGGEKAPVVRRDNAGSAKLKKTDGPPSRIPTMPLVRSDSVTKIVNRRFMKQSQKDELGAGQNQSQSQCQSHNKPPIGKDKKLGPVDDGSCDCSARTLTSCFARASRNNLRHTHGHCKLRPHECPTAAGTKGHPLSQ